MNHSEIVSFLWGVADLIRDTFKRGKYQDVILPLTVLRRLDCVLGSTISALLDQGVDLSLASDLVGHCSATTTKRYDRRGERARHAAASVLAVPYASAERS